MKIPIRCLALFGVCAALVAGDLSAVRAQAPTLAVSNVTIVAGKTFALPLDGNDPGGNPLTFAVIYNSWTNLTTRLVTTNRTLKLNVSVNSVTYTTNFSSATYTTNISLGQGTNVLFVDGAGNAGCNGTYYWDTAKAVNSGSQHGAYTNDSGAAMYVFLHNYFSKWDFNDDVTDYYQADTPTGAWTTIGSGTVPAPTVTFDGDTPGALIITTNGVTSYTTNTTATTGDLMLELFEHLTPKTTARIISLVKSNFYNGLTFHRVIQNFMAQGGDPLGTGAGGSGVQLDDEFVAGLTFEGFGQLAMANSGFLVPPSTLGRDNNDSQFFVTSPNLSVGGTQPPLHLNYRHTIFGQLTHGFDIFGQVMNTPVDGNSKPLSSVVINTATIITNRQATVLYLTAPTNTGLTVTMTVQARSSSGTNQATFQVNIVGDTRHDPPFFYPMPASLVTTQNVTTGFAFNWYGGSTNNLGLWDADTGNWVNSVQVSLYNGILYLTPATGFIGRANLLFGIWDGYDHNGDGTSGAGGDIQEYDSQRVLLTVVQPNLGEALNLPGTTWASDDSTNGHAVWFRETTTTHDGSAALQSGHIGTITGTNSIYSWTEITTNGPGSIVFWWKASTGTNAFLGFFINGSQVNSITGVTGWQQYATYLSTTGSVRFTWAYNKARGTSGGADCGWLDQVAWVPCPYAASVPQLFFQDNNGLLASWILNSTGGVQFVRLPASTGSWALKAAGDIDGDGISDLLFQTPGGDTGGWFMNADGTTRDARYWWNIGSWEIKACADFEGTGRGQLFFQTPAGQVAYWKLETNGVFQSAVQLGNMGAWKLRGAGDINGDGKAELFWQNASGAVAIWTRDAFGSIHSTLAFNTGEWALCGVADVDHDGVCDLIWQTPDTRTGGWFMQTNSVARDARFWWPTGGWKLKAAGR